MQHDRTLEKKYLKKTLESPRLIMKSCLKSADCLEESGQICTKSNVCDCKLNFFFDDAKKSCKSLKSIGESCTDTIECQANAKLKCISGIKLKTFKNFF